MSSSAYINKKIHSGAYVIRNNEFRQTSRLFLIVVVAAIVNLFFWNNKIFANSPYILTYDQSGFQMNGKSIILRGGTVQWFRMPESQWEKRLNYFRAAGFNTIDMYVAWNQIESAPGVFNFEKPNIKKFLELAQKLGLYVYFRPGPYITNEMDAGGLPSWLLKSTTKGSLDSDGKVNLRDADPDYLFAVQRYLKNLNAFIQPYLSTHGGPIILYALENEYDYMELFQELDKRFLSAGSHERPWMWRMSTDQYFDSLKKMVRESGVDIPLTTCPSVPNSFPFGTGNSDEIIPMPNMYRPDALEKNVRAHLGSMHKAGSKYSKMPSGITESDRTASRMKRIIMGGMDAAFGFNIFGFSQSGFMNSIVYTGFDVVKFFVLPELAMREFGEKGQLSYFSGVVDYDGPVSASGGLREKFYDYRRANIFIDDFQSVLGPIVRAQSSEDFSPDASESLQIANSDLGALEGNSRFHYSLNGGEKGSFLQVLNETGTDQVVNTNGIRFKNIVFPKYTSIVMESEKTGGIHPLDVKEDKINSTIMPVNLKITAEIKMNYYAGDVLSLRDFNSEKILVVYGKNGSFGELSASANSRIEMLNCGANFKTVNSEFSGGVNQLTMTMRYDRFSQCSLRSANGKSIRIIATTRQEAGRFWFLKDKSTGEDLLVSGPDMIVEKFVDGNNISASVSIERKSSDIIVLSKSGTRNLGAAHTTSDLNLDLGTNQKSFRVAAVLERNNRREASKFAQWQGFAKSSEELEFNTPKIIYEATFDLNEAYLGNGNKFNIWVEGASDFVSIDVNDVYVGTLNPLGTSIYGFADNSRYSFEEFSKHLKPGKNIVRFRVESWGHGSFMFPKGKLITTPWMQLPSLGFDSKKGLWGNVNLDMIDSFGSKTSTQINQWSAWALAETDLSKLTHTNIVKFNEVNTTVKFAPGAQSVACLNLAKTDLKTNLEYDVPMVAELKGKNAKATLFLNGIAVGRWISDNDWLKKGTWANPTRILWMRTNPNHFPIDALSLHDGNNDLCALIDDVSLPAEAQRGFLESFRILNNEEMYGGIEVEDKKGTLGLLHFNFSAL